MKIFCIGMFRTGTTSLGYALETLGYKTLHGPWWSDGMLKDPFYEKPQMWPPYYSLIKSTIKNYEAFEDYPWMYLYEECDKWFPDAKFILTIRDPERVVASTINQYGSSGRPLWKMPSRNKIIKRYLTHFYRVVNYFRSKKNLLIMNLEAGDGWNKLCPFLDVNEVNLEFPHRNKGNYESRIQN
ncbi:MAG: sulfotransferase [Candidatus Omnitrophica bacterium]|nr:sulfotransferase [Candidatus Omnitrophota bacterium]